MKNIAKIITICGGVQGLYASIENEPFMRLVIEDIGQGPRGHQAISVAHYFVQNGDLCQDPEMAFELVPEGEGVKYEPYMFQQAIPPIYQEVFETGTENERLKRQLTSFARTWDRNIGAQGFVIAAAKQQVGTKGGEGVKPSFPERGEPLRYVASHQAGLSLRTRTRSSTREEWFTPTAPMTSCVPSRIEESARKPTGIIRFAAKSAAPRRSDRSFSPSMRALSSRQSAKRNTANRIRSRPERSFITPGVTTRRTSISTKWSKRPPVLFGCNRSRQRRPKQDSCKVGKTAIAGQRFGSHHQAPGFRFRRRPEHPFQAWCGVRLGRPAECLFLVCLTESRLLLQLTQKYFSTVPGFSPRNSLCIHRGANFRKPGTRSKGIQDATHFPLLR